MWNDRRLVRRAARGDSDAFAAIFRHYGQDLYRYCVAILGDPQDAQDALQNTMVKALRALPGERREIELKPWLYRVAHNEAVGLRRRTRPSEPLAEDAPAPGAGLAQTAADRGRLRDLLADIGELPERHRGVLVMRELAGFDFEEIAAVLDTSAGAARQVLYEARRSLQQMSDGREMSCDAVTALLSDRDGRVARRRDVRAHLRACPDCRRFATAIRSRRETLAGIAPLPAVAAAAIAKSALTGAAGSGSVGGGAAGAAGGAAVKVASTGAIVKSAAAVVAVVAVGAVAVQHEHLLPHRDAAGAGLHARAAEARAASGDPVGGANAASNAGRAGVSAARPGPRSAVARGRRVEDVGLKRSHLAETRPAAGTAAGGAARSDAEGAGGSGATGAPTGAAHPAHPLHPLHPAHPDQPLHPPRRSHAKHPVHPAHPAPPNQPVHPARSAQSARPSQQPHPAHPSTSSRPEAPSRPQQPAAVTAPAKGTDPAAAHPEGPADPTAAATESAVVESLPTGEESDAAAAAPRGNDGR